jgi:hypothetical protein
MKNYLVFGGSLRSALELPDLPEAAAGPVPNWTLLVQQGPPPPACGRLVGSHAVGPWAYELHSRDGGVRLTFAHHYVFDVDSQGSEITWYTHEKASEENVRALLLGPVLALAHHQSGRLCLHGSAAAIDGDAIAFLANKYQGKSTLALALALSGARLISDDAVLVDISGPMQVLPGVHSIRLWEDSLATLTAAGLDCRHLTGVKSTLTALPDHLLMTCPPDCGLCTCSDRCPRPRLKQPPNGRCSLRQMPPWR